MIRQKGAVLVIGIGGGIGGAAARALLARGWTVRALVRDLAKVAQGWPAEIQWIEGDALDAQAVASAAAALMSAPARLVTAVSDRRTSRPVGVPL